MVNNELQPYAVLILVVMDDPLRGKTSSVIVIVLYIVLILVVMDDPLRDCQCFDKRTENHVS